MSFLVPVLNLVTAMWTLYRVRSAIGILRDRANGQLAQQKRRDKFQPAGP